MNIIFLAILLLNAFIALNASPVGNVLEDITNPMESMLSLNFQIHFNIFNHSF